MINLLQIRKCDTLHIKRIKEKNHMNISTDEGKRLLRRKHAFMVKALKHL
jgi:hypothetical protein